jgi:anti-anti-sigma factor
VQTTEIDLSTADAFRAELARATAELGGEPGTVVIDCAEVQFMDSTGVAVLVRLKERLAASGLDLEVRNLPGAIAEPSQRWLSPGTWG